MASTQKKGNSRKKTPAPPPPPAYNAAARMAGGIVCALLALCVLVSYFNVDALLLVWIARVLKGVLGYGYYLTAPVLAAIAVIQLGHRGRPVVLRTTCVALLPLLVGVLCHLALCRTAYTLGLDSVKTLWATDRPSSAAACSPAVWPWAARPWSARWCPSSCSWCCCWPPCWAPCT